MMREIFDFGVDDPYNWKTFDQYYINKYYGDKRIYINILPQIFNTFWTPEIDYQKTAFCHYTGMMPTLEKRNYIEQYHPRTMLL
jgi:hypothetical protein